MLGWLQRACMYYICEQHTTSLQLHTVLLLNVYNGKAKIHNNDVCSELNGWVYNVHSYIVNGQHV